MLLDVDDVLCLNNPTGCHDVLAALRQISACGRQASDFDEIWRTVFDTGCVERLRQLHQAFTPRYVLTTSWCNFMNLAAFRILFRHSGLDFIADNLHPHWETPKQHRRVADRRREILGWIAANPADASQWVVLDDEQSGSGLIDWPHLAERRYIVLCRERVGLDDARAGDVRSALATRTG